MTNTTLYVVNEQDIAELDPNKWHYICDRCESRVGIHKSSYDLIKKMDGKVTLICNRCVDPIDILISTFVPNQKSCQ